MKWQIAGVLRTPALGAVSTAARRSYRHHRKHAGLHPAADHLTGARSISRTRGVGFTSLHENLDTTTLVADWCCACRNRPPSLPAPRNERAG